jgi:hypothetical protein
MNDNCLETSLTLQVSLRGSQQCSSYNAKANVQDNNDNNFARLSPNTARRLHDLAVQKLLLRKESYHDQEFVGGRNMWRIHDETRSSRCASGIEFLPLAITFESTGETVYASYNGGDLDVAQYQVGSLSHQGPF